MTLGALAGVLLAGAATAQTYRPSVPPDRAQPAQEQPAAPALEPTQEQEGGPFVQRLGPFQRPPYTPGEDTGDRPAYRVVDRDSFARLHNGFYLRLSGGIGILNDSARSKDLTFVSDGENADGGNYRGSASGLQVATEASLGWTTPSGFTVGLGVYTATMPEAEVDQPKYGNDEVQAISTRPVPQHVGQLAVVGPFVDYFFDTRSGFHTSLALGLSTYIAGQSLGTAYPRTRGHVAIGLGFVAGVGYDFWIADEWSLGLLGRVAYGWSEGTDPKSNDWSHKVLAPAALLSLTYN